MTVLTAFAYGIYTFGPPVALFFVTVARHPHEIITMILGAFFWLLALLFASLVWIIVIPLKDTPAFTLPISVILQEVFRWLYFKLLKKADHLLEIVSEDKSDLRKHKIAYVGGLGFGLIAGIVMFANVLSVASGPGTVRSNQYFVTVSAFSTQVMIILHICWGVIFFAGLESKNWLYIFAVPISHMFISCLSLLINLANTPAYFLSFGYFLCVVFVALAFFAAGARPKTLVDFFKR
ncbi:PREDICTED: gamma-secretase subunit Aph-1b-like [Amphimedon queenslandica]|uniref:Gamma-secretase subunit Aph-1 n=1 Tax=Amphimedon queenslandica TaxID=400682 RepID=A0A1X7VUB5_AMPQE|nr:PREDICTED: gamma-secretase subunit Aph-1b-like [Amphimedon queenslandica]|eukprot:XP_003382482.1 PREDICTED: gamma-secretase subunit Aph-1b-like [Amphimedon queenslandica]